MPARKRSVFRSMLLAKEATRVLALIDASRVPAAQVVGEALLLLGREHRGGERRLCVGATDQEGYAADALA
jgi:hypothetical protein